MPNMEDLLLQIPVEITRDRTAQLFIPKLNLDHYTYKSNYPKKQADNVGSQNRRKIQQKLQIQKKILRSCRYTHNVQRSKISEHSETPS